MSERRTVVIWEDRHSDTTVHLFTDTAAAVGWAWDQAHGMRPGQVTHETYPDGEVCISYGVESDCLRVIPAVKVDAELEQSS